MMKTALLGAAIAIAAPAVAQNYNEILRFGAKDYATTARGKGLAGATGTMGADFGGISVNPGSLGLFRRSQSTLSMGLDAFGNRSTYLGSDNGESVLNFNVPSLGVVFANEQMKMGSSVEDGWKVVNFSFGLNRVGSQWRREYLEGTNTQSSITDVWRDQATGIHPSELDPGFFEYPDLAYFAGLIFPYPDDSFSYFSLLDYDADINPNISLQQSDFIDTRGSRNEFFIALGGNYSDKLYAGVSLSYQSLSFRSLREFYEENTGPVRDYYRSATLQEDVNTRGSGFMANLGLIYAASPYVRVGLSGQTPTFYRLTDNYSYTIVGARGSGGGTYSSSTPEGEFTYNMSTPWRLTGSGTFLVPDLGENRQMLINADVEYIAYNSGKLNSRSYTYKAENEGIRDLLQPAVNARLGAELKLGTPIVRAGYAYNTSPLKSASRINASDLASHTFGIGGGLREQGYYLDLGFSYTVSSYSYLPYVSFSDAANTARLTNSRFATLLTIGTYF